MAQSGWFKLSLHTFQHARSWYFLHSAIRVHEPSYLERLRYTYTKMRGPRASRMKQPQSKVHNFSQSAVITIGLCTQFHNSSASKQASSGLLERTENCSLMRMLANASHLATWSNSIVIQHAAIGRALLLLVPRSLLCHKRSF